MSKLYSKVKKLPLVMVTWLDATDRNLKEEELLGKGVVSLLTERVTVGWQYKNNSEGVVLIRDICEDGDVETCTIPRKMIVGVK